MSPEREERDAAIIGYKIGYLVLADETAVRVSGLTAGSDAPYGARGVATCTRAAHEGVCLLACTCGFHAYAERADAMDALGEYSAQRGIPVLLTVELWSGQHGYIVEHERGWRAPAQDIVRVEILGACALCLQSGTQRPADLLGDLTGAGQRGVGGVSPLCLGCAHEADVATYSPREIAVRLGLEAARVSVMDEAATRGALTALTGPRIHPSRLHELTALQALGRCEVEALVRQGLEAVHAAVGDIIAAILGDSGAHPEQMRYLLAQALPLPECAALVDELLAEDSTSPHETPRRAQLREVLGQRRAGTGAEATHLQVLDQLGIPAMVLAVRDAQAQRSK